MPCVCWEDASVDVTDALLDAALMGRPYGQLVSCRLGFCETRLPEPTYTRKGSRLDCGPESSAPAYVPAGGIALTALSRARVAIKPLPAMCYVHSTAAYTIIGVKMGGFLDDMSLARSREYP